MADTCVIADGKFQPSGISGEVTPWLYSDGHHGHGHGRHDHDHCSGLDL